MFRSVGAVFLGYLTMMIPIIAVDFVMGVVAMQGQMPKDEQQMQAVIEAHATAFSIGNSITGFFAGIASGYVAAWIARRRELLHALALLGLTEAFGLLYVVGARLNAEVRHEPLWYLAAQLVLPVLTIPAGGVLRARHVRQRGLALDAPVPAPNK